MNDDGDTEKLRFQLGELEWSYSAELLSKLDRDIGRDLS